MSSLLLVDTKEQPANADVKAMQEATAATAKLFFFINTFSYNRNTIKISTTII